MHHGLTFRRRPCLQASSTTRINLSLPSIIIYSVGVIYVITCPIATCPFDLKRHPAIDSAGIERLIGQLMTYAVKPIPKYRTSGVPHPSRFSVRLHQTLCLFQICFSLTKKTCRVDWSSSSGMKLTPTKPKVALCGDDLLDAFQRVGSIIVARDP